MSYDPYEWEDGPSGGTPITAERLNAIEQGIATNGPGIVAVLGPADPIPGGTPPGLIVRLAE